MAPMHAAQAQAMVTQGCSAHSTQASIDVYARVRRRIPPEAATPLREVDGQGDVGQQGDQQDDCDPGLQSSGQVGAGCHDVKQLGPCTTTNADSAAVLRSVAACGIMYKAATGNKAAGQR